MSILQVVNAFEREYRRVQAAGCTYSTSEQQRRLSMLVEWSISLGRYGVADFQRTLKRHIAGEHGNTAMACLSDCYQLLGISGVEALIDFCNKG